MNATARKRLRSAARRGVGSALPATLLAVLAACTDSPDADEGVLLSETGSELYTYHCSACHGARGEGDGPVADVMNISVPNLRTLSERSGGTFPRETIAAFIDGRNLPAAHGDRYMPIWGAVFSQPDALDLESDGRPNEELVDLRLNAIVGFLERLQNE